MQNKAFIITIDTEGDNQWNLDAPITTENVAYLPRFQELCEKYGFKPVWLSNYEMVMDDKFVAYFKPKQDAGLCEIGMHLHAWNTPPEYDLPKKTKERSYLIEYPYDSMEDKISTMTRLIKEKFGRAPISHRSGRWAINSDYEKLLAKYGYKVDCSATPRINWAMHQGQTGAPGTDYSNANQYLNKMDNDIWEMPLTVRKLHFFDLDRVHSARNIAGEAKRLIQGRMQWMRVDNTQSIMGVNKLVDVVVKDEKADYLMFMIHSSELMPGCNPTFTKTEDIEWLYKKFEEIFDNLTKLGFVGKTIEEYINEKNL